MERVVVGTVLTYCDYCDSADRQGEGYSPYEGPQEAAIASGWLETNTGLQCLLCLEEAEKTRLANEAAGIEESVSVGANAELENVVNLSVDRTLPNAVPEGQMVRETYRVEADGTRTLIKQDVRMPKEAS